MKNKIYSISHKSLLKHIDKINLNLPMKTVKLGDITFLISVTKLTRCAAEISVKPVGLNGTAHLTSGNGQKKNQGTGWYWTEKVSCVRDETHR